MSQSNTTTPDNGGDLRDMRVAALKYNTEKDSAPIVVAAGSGYVAQKILSIADECGVSIYHDDNAATLLSKLELGQSIPPELYQLVVEIYMTVIAASTAAKTAAITPSKQQGKNNLSNIVDNAKKR